MRQDEWGYIGGEGHWEPFRYHTNPPHVRGRRLRITSSQAWLTRELTAQLLWFKTEANDAGADAEFGAVLEHGGAHALFVEEGAIGRIEILQVRKGFAYLEEAMVPRNLLVVQWNIGILASQDDPSLLQLVHRAFSRARNNGEQHGFGRRKLHARVGRR